MKKILFTAVLACLAAACIAPLPQVPKLNLSLPVAATEETSWNSADYKGKPILIAFMGSWCPWCKRSLPALDAASAAFAGKAEVVGAFADSDKEAVLAVIKQHNMQTKALYNARQAGTEMGVQGFPHIMLFDKKHRLVRTWNGYSPDLEAQFKNELTKLTK